MKIKNLLIDFSYGIIRKIQVSGKYKVAKVVNPDKCTRCTRCENACPFPFNAIKVDVNNGISINSERCIGCGHCEKVCKEQVIEIFSQESRKKVCHGNCAKNKI
ncbi:MAG: 4Fe-4S dicluster domain-containing protein [Methanobacterium sp.]